jgi:hypothetical protein
MRLWPGIEDGNLMQRRLILTDFSCWPLRDRRVLCHRGDPARRIEATAYSRLPNLDAALSCVVYAHLDPRRECAPTSLAQRTCAYRVNTYGTKGLRSRRDRRAAGEHHSGWDTGFRFQ